MFMGEKFGRDPIWEGHLATEIFAAELEVDAVLYETEVPISRIMSLDVGDTLMFDIGPKDPVTVKCGDIALSAGGLGCVDNRIAIALNSGLNRQKMTLSAFEKAMQKEMETS